MSPTPRLPQSLEQQVHARVAWCYDRADAHFNQAFPRPEIRFDQRGRIAGSAVLQLNRLRFHPRLLMEHQDHFIEHVVAHEVAHLVVWQRYGRVRPHGAQWQAVMDQVLGVVPQRTHSYAVQPSRTLRRFHYRCDCREHQLSSIRHNRILRGQTYRCLCCGQALQAVA